MLVAGGVAVAVIYLAYLSLMSSNVLAAVFLSSAASLIVLVMLQKSFDAGVVYEDSQNEEKEGDEGA